MPGQVGNMTNKSSANLVVFVLDVDDIIGGAHTDTGDAHTDGLERSRWTFVTGDCAAVTEPVQQLPFCLELNAAR